MNAYGIGFSPPPYSSADKFYINGNVGIGTATPDEKLTVKGKINTQEVREDMLGALVPDYVFAHDYKLKTLEEVESYILKNSIYMKYPPQRSFKKMDYSSLR